MQGNQGGFTLAELIIALSLLVIVITLGHSLYIIGIKSFIRETTAIEQQAHLRLALSNISRNIRMTPSSRITVINEESLKVDDGTYRMNLTRDTLLYKGNPLAVGVKSFKVRELEGGKRIFIEIHSSGEKGHLSTIISLQR
ncbi:MAG: PilW family protein [Clostridia bacterium]|jgi:prepilin-type N-terminal cleavage/methylation domain-containing protein